VCVSKFGIKTQIAVHLCFQSACVAVCVAACVATWVAVRNAVCVAVSATQCVFHIDMSY